MECLWRVTGSQIRHQGMLCTGVTEVCPLCPPAFSGTAGNCPSTGSSTESAIGYGMIAGGQNEFYNILTLVREKYFLSSITNFLTK